MPLLLPYLLTFHIGKGFLFSSIYLLACCFVGVVVCLFVFSSMGSWILTFFHWLQSVIKMNYFNALVFPDLTDRTSLSWHLGPLTCLHYSLRTFLFFGRTKYSGLKKIKKHETECKMNFGLVPG